MSTPHVDIIDPLGGGDFTTLALWEADVDGDPESQGHAGYHAECVGTTSAEAACNTGHTVVSGWSTTPNATDHPRIYAAPGDGQDGTLSTAESGSARSQTAGIAMSLYEDYCEIDGLAFVFTSNGDEGVRLHTVSGGAPLGANHTIKNCFFTPDFNIEHGMSVFAFSNNTAGQTFGPWTIQNCCWSYYRANANHFGDACIEVNLASGDDYTISILNCSMYLGSWDGFRHHRGVVLGTEGSGHATVTVVNNAIAEVASSQAFVWPSSVTATSLNNAATDATADDAGGSGHLVNETASDWWGGILGRDFTITDASNLHDAGTSTSAPVDDMLGTSRPQGAEYDIGAVELVEPGGVEVTPSPIVVNWTAPAPSLALNRSPSPQAAQWSAPSPGLSASLSPDPVTVEWSSVIAALTLNHSPAPVVAEWSSPAPGTSLFMIPAPAKAQWSVVDATLSISQSPAPVAAEWADIQPAISKSMIVIPSPVVCEWSAVAAGLSLSASPEPAEAQWSTVPPNTSLSLSTGPVEARWSAPSPGLSVALSPAPVAAEWSVLLPGTAIDLSPDPVAAEWTALLPTISLADVVDLLASGMIVDVMGQFSDTSLDPVAVVTLTHTITTREHLNFPHDVELQGPKPVDVVI